MHSSKVYSTTGINLIPRYIHVAIPRYFFKTEPWFNFSDTLQPYRCSSVSAHLQVVFSLSRRLQRVKKKEMFCDYRMCCQQKLLNVDLHVVQSIRNPLAHMCQKKLLIVLIADPCQPFHLYTYMHTCLTSVGLAQAPQ